MSIDPASAATAYARLASAAKSATSDTEAVAGESTAGGQFAGLVKEAMAAMSKTGSAAETQAVAGATEDAELVDVVTSISAAELTLQTVVAVRDKVIAAYQDIMKMPI